jgi:hypothetical protein
LDSRVTLKAEMVELSSLLNMIREQTRVRFIFSSKAIQASRTLSVNSKEKRLADFLDEYLKPMGVGYNLVRDQILLFAMNEASVNPQRIDPDGAREAKPQAVTINGIVRDTAGVGLSGASVVLKANAKAGTTTDASGRFSLSVESLPATLLVSFTGFQTKEVTVASAAESVSIQMEAAASNTMSDIVVVGYGTQKKANLTGAVDQVTSEVFENRALTNLNQGLVGVLPNLNIRMLDGKPNQSPAFNIRGATSIGQGGNALVLIDGVEGDPQCHQPQRHRQHLDPERCRLGFHLRCARRFRCGTDHHEEPDEGQDLCHLFRELQHQVTHGDARLRQRRLYMGEEVRRILRRMGRAVPPGHQQDDEVLAGLPGRIGATLQNPGSS